MINRQTRLYLLAVYACALGALAAMIIGNPRLLWGPLVLFALLSFASESLPVEVPRSARVSVSFSIYMAALILFGPAVAALSAVVGALNWPDLRERLPLYKLAFNGAQIVVSIAAASGVYHLLGGVYGSAWRFPHALVPTSVASLAYLLTNTLLVSCVIALSERANPLRIWQADFYPHARNSIALFVLAVIMVEIYLTVGPAGLLLLIAPLLVARQTLQVYMKLTEAYQGTIRSLVAAIEAKDSYTKGHSERVADYAEIIGRQLKISHAEIEKLRISALLHDLGKIGIQRRILSKPGRLSPEEYALMQEHPELATSILRDVHFLEDIIPTIYHHHEHYDGSGYAKNLKGDQIPFAARILAVADAYDAMTSVRPYRGALSPEAAAAELLSCSGSQFDRKVVEALLAGTHVEPQSAGDVTLAEGQLRILEDTI